MRPYAPKLGEYSEFLSGFYFATSPRVSLNLNVQINQKFMQSNLFKISKIISKLVKVFFIKMIF